MTIKPFPNSNTPNKEADYYLAAVQAFWSWKENGLTAFPSDFPTKLEENRLYARGKQPVQKYIDYYTSPEGQQEVQRIQHDFIDQGTSKEHVREGFANMDFENIPTIAPKIALSLHGQFDDVDYVVSARSTDSRSGSERDKMKWKNWLFTTDREWYRKVEAMGGVQLEEPDFFPDSIAELHLHESAGGYKIPWETAIEKAASHSFDISNWDEIKSECLDDVIAANKFAVGLETCKKSGKRMGKYIDLGKFTIQWSKHYDHRDSEMAGHWDEVTVGTLAQFFNRQDLEKIAKQYCGKLNNPEDFDQYRGTDAMGLFKYDFFKVPVFYFSFIDYDNDHKVSYMAGAASGASYGRAIDRSVSYDYTPKKGEKKTTTSIRKLKKVSWIIGTEFVYDYGVDRDMVRPSEKDVMLPYVCISLPGKSITESAKVYYDDLVHIHLKTMNALITASSAGFAIDAGAMEGVTLGGSKIDELTLFDLYRHKGILIFKRKDAFLQQTTGSASPIIELPGGIGRFLDEQLRLFEFTMKMLENITGINPVTLGGVPEERAAVRNVQMSVKGTENILRPIIRGLRKLKQNMGINFALSIPYLIQHYPESYEAYEKVLGKPSVELLKMIKENIYQMGIMLEPMLTTTHQETLMQMVNLALQKDSQGQAGLTVSEAMLIQERIILGAPLKMVRLEVSNMIRKAQAKIDKHREDMIRVQSEEAQKLEQMKHQQLLQKVDIETMAQKDLDDNQSNNRIKENYAKSNLQVMENMVNQIEEEEKQKQLQDAAIGA